MDLDVIWTADDIENLLKQQGVEYAPEAVRTAIQEADPQNADVLARQISEMHGETSTPPLAVRMPSAVRANNFSTVFETIHMSLTHTEPRDHAFRCTRMTHAVFVKLGDEATGNIMLSGMAARALTMADRRDKDHAVSAAVFGRFDESVVRRAVYLTQIRLAAIDKKMQLNDADEAALTTDYVDPDELKERGLTDLHEAMTQGRTPFHDPRKMKNLCARYIVTYNTVEAHDAGNDMMQKLGANGLNVPEPGAYDVLMFQEAIGLFLANRYINAVSTLAPDVFKAAPSRTDKPRSSPPSGQTLE